jgi:hypothetical protein
MGLRAEKRFTPWTRRMPRAQWIGLMMNLLRHGRHGRRVPGGYYAFTIAYLLKTCYFIK